MATKPVLLAAAILLLAGCDFIADKAAGNVTEQEAKDGFIEGCVKGALKPESFKRPLSQEEATKLCHCAYDTASAQYTDRAKWKRDLVRAGLSPNDQNQEIFQKLIVGLQSCAANQNLM
ncbi:hypothetical protein [Eikenella halliae]|uniref:hypothetical protein n=1 Tax=Eikenella halliae TaxID=1795832 RepID=UPI003612A42F